MKRDRQPLPHSDHLMPHSEWGAREPTGGSMTQQQTSRKAPNPVPGGPPPTPKRSRWWLWALLGVALAGVGSVVAGGELSTHSASTGHTVVYTATADSASGAGRTGMVTAQAPGGTTQKTGLLPITGTSTFHSGDVVYLSVQNGQGVGSVTCRITVDGVVVSENTSDGGYTIATCQGTIS